MEISKEMQLRGEQVQAAFEEAKKNLSNSKDAYNKYVEECASELTETHKDLVGKKVRIWLRRSQWDIDHDVAQHHIDCYFDGFESAGGSLWSLTTHKEVAPIMWNIKKDGSKGAQKKSFYSSIKDIERISPME